MDFEKLMDLASEAGQARRSNDGQVTLKYLRDVLALLPSDMPCKFDTGHNFGMDPVEYTKEPAYESTEHPDFSTPEYDVAFSKTSYPSAYRG